MAKCKCYDDMLGRCNGTVEKMICNCNGDVIKCDFFYDQETYKMYDRKRTENTKNHNKELLINTVSNHDKAINTLFYVASEQTEQIIKLTYIIREQKQEIMRMSDTIEELDPSRKKYSENAEFVAGKLDAYDLLTQLAEEASELSLAALKCSRALKDTNPTPIGVSKAYYDIMVGIDFSKGEGVGALIVGRKRPNDSVEIINAFQGEEARWMYERLITKKEKKT